MRFLPLFPPPVDRNELRPYQGEGTRYLSASGAGPCYDSTSCPAPAASSKQEDGSSKPDPCSSDSANVQRTSDSAAEVRGLAPEYAATLPAKAEYMISTSDSAVEVRGHAPEYAAHLLAKAEYMNSMNTSSIRKEENSNETAGR